MSKHENLSTERKHLQSIGVVPSWYTTQALQMFNNSYAQPNEESVRGRFKEIAKVARHLPKEHQDYYEKRFFDLMWNGHLSPSSPVLANTGTSFGHSVACSGQDIQDNVYSFYNNLTETALLSKHAFGTSGYFGNIRPRGSQFGNGGKANGVLPVINDFFTCADKISQGGVRKGSFAAYLDLDHPDFNECLLSLKANPTGKNYGWVIKESVAQMIRDGDPEMVKRWKDALHVKLLTGKGYLFFPDKANNHRPQMYKDLGLEVQASNLCCEIRLFSDASHTFSCILSSINLVHWDTIKDDDTIFDSMVFLDCITSEFLEKSKNEVGLEKVRAFTEKGRAVGLGVMGFHTYLQSKGIPYDSLEAMYLSNSMAKRMHTESLRASQWLADVLGEPEWCKGYGVRNTHRTAYAPTKSTALLMGGVSESTFADPAFAYTSASAVGELERIPPVLYQTMIDKGVYSPETVKDIVNHLGSVQHVTWLTEDEKKVFKNAFEMSPWNFLRQAKSRQKWICQGQSINLHIPEEGAEELTTQLMSACLDDPDTEGVYYIYTRSGVIVPDECVSCSG